MVRHRGDGGFQRAGTIGAAGAGLPKALTRKLELENAWRQVAGPVLAGRVRAVQIRQGVLELGVDDAAWARQVIPLLPHLAAKLTRIAPGLGVRKFRVTVAGEVRVPPTVPPDAGPAEEAAASSPAAGKVAAASDSPAPPSDPARLLARVSERYLAAAERRRPRPPRG